MSKLIHLLIILVSVGLLFVGNFFVGGFTPPTNEDVLPTFTAYIEEIFEIGEYSIPWHTDEHGNVLEYNHITAIIFMARLTGDEGGREVLGEQILTSLNITPTRQVQEGDRVILQYDYQNRVFTVTEFIRIQYIVIFGAIIVLVILIFGRMQGLNSIVALALTIGALFFVFIPAILAGVNIYLATILVCLYSVVSTILIVIGVTKKSFSTIIGCLTALTATGLLVIIMHNILGMTGAVDSDTLSLLMFDATIDLHAVMFAGIVIGAVGAILDVAMSISSALWEVSQAGEGSFKGLYASGISIGKDILGTMANTLLLAYIGSSITVILVILNTFVDVTNIFHHEMIILELLRSLVGIFGIFLAIPITTVVCGVLYSKK